MKEPVECEIWIAMNEEGDWVVVTDGASEAHEKLNEDVGGNSCRVARVVVRMRPPVDPDDESAAEVEVPDEVVEPVTATASA